jgi:hypothetical protein
MSLDKVRPRSSHFAASGCGHVPLFFSGNVKQLEEPTADCSHPDQHCLLLLFARNPAGDVPFPLFECADKSGAGGDVTLRGLLPVGIELRHLNQQEGRASRTAVELCHFQHRHFGQSERNFVHLSSGPCHFSLGDSFCIADWSVRWFIPCQDGCQERDYDFTSWDLMLKGQARIGVANLD